MNDVVTIPASVKSRGLDAAQWNTLCGSLFPGAKVDSVLMAVDYCRARKLDVMKKPCHIVPIRVKQGDSYVWRDVIMPGIYEYRTTAMRTGLYLGHTEPEYGPVGEYAGCTVNTWCSMVMRRWNERAGCVAEFPVKVLFAEVVALKDGKANQRWAQAPVQMMTKCCEAAGLREAFPDELGGTSTEEEMAGRIIDAAVIENIERGGAVGSHDAEPAEPAKKKGKPKAEEPEATEGIALVTPPMIRILESKLASTQIGVVDCCEQFGVKRLEDIPFESMNDVLRWIEKNSG